MIRTALFLALLYGFAPIAIENISWIIDKAAKYDEIKAQAEIIRLNPAFRIPLKG